VSTPPPRDLAAIILAVGLVTALNTLTLGVWWEAVFRTGSAGLSENATQILTGWGGGIVGILGAMFGYRAGARSDRPPPDTNTDT
jgi:hypothetical protein